MSNKACEGQFWFGGPHLAVLSRTCSAVDWNQISGKQSLWMGPLCYFPGPRVISEVDLFVKHLLSYNLLFFAVAEERERQGGSTGGWKGRG